MAKATRKKKVTVTYVKAAGIKCPYCPKNFVAEPGKNPAKLLANHIQRRHSGRQTTAQAQTCR